MNARPFNSRDLDWIELIAEQFDGEWEAWLELAANPDCLWFWVVEPYCAVATYDDGHGNVIVGLADKMAGVKHMIRLMRRLRDRLGVPLHSHCGEGTWQARLFESNGFVRDADGVLRLPAVKGG